MTYYEMGNGIWIGLKADTKPLTGIPTNSILWERDTGLQYYWNGIRWVVRGIMFPSIRKTGAWQGGHTSSNIGEGLCSSMTNFVGGVSGAASTSLNPDATRGKGQSFNTTTTSVLAAGLRSGQLTTLTALNPRFKCKFRLPSIADVNLWVGWGPAVIPSTDTYLTNNTGILFGIYGRNNTTGPGSTVGWQVAHHSGSVAAATVDPVGITADTNDHTIEIEAISSTPKYRYSLDDGAWVDITADNPTTTGMCPMAIISNGVGANDKTVELYYVEIDQDK